MPLGDCCIQRERAEAREKGKEKRDKDDKEKEAPAGDKGKGRSKAAASGEASAKKDKEDVKPKNPAAQPIAPTKEMTEQEKQVFCFLLLVFLLYCSCLI